MLFCLVVSDKSTIFAVSKMVVMVLPFNPKRFKNYGKSNLCGQHPKAKRH
nr:MAG TPA: Tumor necrosis factor ligand superfamily, cytokine, CRD, receptor, jelly-roll.9A [Caudoviricetes sp.]